MLGWVAFVLILSAGLLPLGYRLRLERRAAPGSPTINAHTALGLLAATVAFAHSGSILTSLGSPAVVRSPTAALVPAAAAFFLLVAHVGIGLRLRNPKLRDRGKFRKRHLVLAGSIVILAGLHVFFVTHAV